MSKFNVKIGECTGAVVVGDHANVTIGQTDGKLTESNKIPYATFSFSSAFLIESSISQEQNLIKDKRKANF